MAQLDDTRWVNEYTDTVRHLAQQQASMLYSVCRVESQESETKNYEAEDAVYLRERQQRGGDRHAAPVIDDPPIYRWTNTMRDWEWDTVVDRQDEIRALADFKGPRMRGGVMACGRQYDMAFTRAVFADANLLEDNGTAVQYTWDAWLGGTGAGRAATAHPDHLLDGPVANRDTTNASSGMTLEKLINAKMTLMGANLTDPGSLNIVMTEKQLGELLADPQLTSQDYMQVKALVDGQMNTALGFRFIIISSNAKAREHSANQLASPAAVADIMLKETGTATNTRRCFAFASNHLVLGEGIAMEVDSGKDPSLGFQWRLHHKLTMGAFRFEDEGVVEIRCLES